MLSQHVMVVFIFKLHHAFVHKLLPTIGQCTNGFEHSMHNAPTIMTSGSNSRATTWE